MDFRSQSAARPADCLFLKPRKRSDAFSPSLNQGRAPQLHVDNSFLLQCFKNSVENAVFAPAVHSHIYRMPGAVLFWQCPPHPFSATYNIALRNWRLSILTFPLCLGRYLSIRSYCSCVISMILFYSLIFFNSIV